MNPNFRTAIVRRLIVAVILFSAVQPLLAQRQMERLGRGVLVLHSATSQAYIGWRLLATDPANVGFNLYRSVNGAAGVKLNSLPLTNTTDYLDTGANFTVSNAWYVVAVTNGVEATPSAAYGLAANSPVRQYVPLPLQPVTGGLFGPYDVKFCWVGDFDGDGEYDYLVDRLSTVAATNQFLQAYKRDGTLLWQMDMGYNSVNQYNIEPGASAISIGHGDMVTVYDLDGDGKSEVIVRTARGVVLPNSTTITGPNDTEQYLSIIEGLTGNELARATITNMWLADGPMNGHFGIMYCDGVRPSVVLHIENRQGSGSFNRETMAYDYRNGQLTRRWFQTPAPGANESWGHQIRIMDVNHDGIDDLLNVGSALSGVNGQPLFDTELVHGDRFHTTDIDPDRPGLEMFSIQQNNGTLLATALIDVGTGGLIKKWYAGGVVDVGRGTALDLTPNVRGVEFYSTQPGIFDCKGNQLYANSIWPPEAIWWDADLSRELEDGAGSGALSPVINKFNPTSGGVDRMYSIYNDGVHQAYGGRAAFWGDILGDWREEVVLVQNDYAALRVYTTKIVATNRLYCLMQNPGYRTQATCKGYYQASYVDYYLGTGMPPAPTPPVSDAKLVWNGGGANVWDANTTANWRTNWFHIGNANTNPATFNSGDTVLFDLSASNNTAITLSGTLTPGDMRVHTPKNFTFDCTNGSLAGGMKLTKGGAGKLTLTGTNTFTGATLISEGAMIVNGALLNSPVTVRGGVWLDGRLGGIGVVGSAVTLNEGAGVSPGQGTNSPGKLTIANNVTFTGRTLNDFDLSDDASGTTKTNDQLIITGNLVLQGTNTFVIRKLNATLPPGIYPLINYSGTLTGSLTNLAVTGLTGIPYVLTNSPGQIALAIKSFRAPATITWTGGSGGNAWNLLTSSNWLNGAAKDVFAPNDTVRFDNIGLTNPTVTLTGDLVCSNIIVDATNTYSFIGSGGILGGGSLTKTNSGTLAITAMNNTFTGKTILSGGTLVVAELDATGYASPLGNPPGGSTNLVLSGNSTLRVLGESYTDRGLTLSSGTNTLDVTNSSDQLTIAGVITGSGALKKVGNGTLAVSANNTFTGPTFISGGGISLGGGTANQYGLGVGPGGNGNTTITISNATLRMYSDSGSYDNCYWNLLVPTNSTATIYADDRVNLYGSLTGGGTLNFNVYYVRTELDGNWSAFAGQLNLGTDSSGGDFRIGNSSGYGNASVNLANYIYAYHVTSGSAVALGALSGGIYSHLSGTAWTVGAKNIDSTFSGSIHGNSLTKVGTGTLTLTGNTNNYTGATTVSAGVLLVNGNNRAATGAVSVGTSGTLGGFGIIGGATTVNGKLSPGSNSIATLSFSNNVTFSATGTAFMEINRTAATKDLVNASGTITYGGTLLVTNLAGALTNGDSFKLFNATAYAGSFPTKNLPVLAVNLAWDTSALAVNGTISVVNALAAAPSAPTNLVATTISYSQINLVWSDTSTNEENFLIERSLDGTNFTQIASVGAGVTAYTNTALSGGTLYHYRVRASNSGGNSAYSNTASTTTAAAPAGLVWRGDGGSNVWDVATTANWRSSGSPSVFNDGATAIFDDSGSNNTSLMLTGLISPGAVNITAAKNYTFAGSGALTNGMALVKTGSGILTISSAQAYSGETFIGAGSLHLNVGGSAGSGTIYLSNNTTLNFSSASSTFIGNPISVPAGATVALGFAVLGSGYSGAISSEDDTSFFIITNAVSMDGQNLKQFQNFSGTVQINSGAHLRYSKTSGVNNGGDSARFVINGLMNTRNGGTMTCGSLAGSGAVTGGNNADGNTTFIVGALGEDTVFSGRIADATPARAISLTKTGSGILTLTGLNTNSLTTTISGGTLQIGDGGVTGTLPTNNVVNNATLAFNRADNTTDGSGIISGSGTVIQNGDGAVTFTKNHTYSGATFIYAGTLAFSGNGSISNSASLTIAHGATLDVTARSSGDLTVNSGKTLAGKGAVNGNLIVASGAKLTPGNGDIGTLTFSNSLTLAAGSLTTMELSTAPVNADRLKVLGTLLCGGSLTVTNPGSGPLANGDSFQLFDAAVINGSFSSLTLPALTGNLFWNTNTLYVTGEISVASPVSGVATNLMFDLAGNNLTLSWPASHLGWTLQAQTNPLGAGLGTNWSDVNGSTATNSVIVPVNPATPAVFYRLYLP